MNEARRRRFWIWVARQFARAQAWALTRAHNGPVWVDTQGNVYAYRELAPSHLSNILRMMRRNGQGDSSVFVALAAEAESRRLRW